MTRAAQIDRIISLALEGLYTTTEAEMLLDALQVRGTFESAEHGFIGYDYSAQRWLTR